MATALQTLRVRWHEVLAAPTPAIAVEIAPGRLLVARAMGEPRGRSRAAWRELAPGAVQPSPVKLNLPEPAAVTEPLRAALAALGAHEGAGAEVTLLVPDLTARVAVLDFDALPRRADELTALARLRLRKSLPFHDEAAAISCQALSPTRLLVTVAERARLDEYEDCLEAAGARAARVLPAGLACLAAQPALEQGALLVRALPGSLSTAFCRQRRVEFFRVIELAAAPAMDDIFPSAAFYRDQCEAAAMAAAGPPLVLTAGVEAELAAEMAEELPWAEVRPVEAAAEWTGVAGPAADLLAVTGALRGKF